MAGKKVLYMYVPQYCTYVYVHHRETLVPSREGRQNPCSLKTDGDMRVRLPKRNSSPHHITSQRIASQSTHCNNLPIKRGGGLKVHTPAYHIIIPRSPATYCTSNSRLFRPPLLHHILTTNQPTSQPWITKSPPMSSCELPLESRSVAAIPGRNTSSSTISSVQFSGRLCWVASCCWYLWWASAVFMLEWDNSQNGLRL